MVGRPTLAGSMDASLSPGLSTGLLFPLYSYPYIYFQLHYTIYNLCLMLFYHMRIFADGASKFCNREIIFNHVLLFYVNINVLMTIFGVFNMFQL